MKAYDKAILPFFLAILLGGPVAWAQLSIASGKLPAGKKITITFEATLKASTPITTTEVCAQSVTGGSNFANESSDDPDTPAADDPTCTPVLVCPGYVISAGPDRKVYPAYPDSACTTLTVTGDGVGAPGTTILWSTGQTTASISVCPTATTTYTVTLTTALGCTYSDEVTVCAVDILCGNSGGQPKLLVCKPGSNPKTQCVGLPSVHNLLINEGYKLGPCEPVSCVPPIVKAPTGEDKGKRTGSSANLQVYPNPFNGRTRIDFDVSSAALTRVDILDINGRPLSTLFNTEAEAGRRYSLEWDASELPAGTYLLRLQTGEDIRFEKLVLSR